MDATLIPALHPIPLFRPLLAAEPYPVEALCELRQAAEAVQRRTQVPIAMAAQSLLAAANLAAAPHVDVALPGAGVRPVVGLFFTVAESGMRKTSTDRAAHAGIDRAVKTMRQAYDRDRLDYLANLEAWKAAKAAATSTKNGKVDRRAIKEALLALGPEPIAPVDPMMIAADPSAEALCLHLKDRTFVGVFTSEAGLILGGHGFSDEKLIGNAAQWNALWDGQAIQRLRVGTGKDSLPGRRVVFHLQAQPGVADRFLSEPRLRSLGLIARALIVRPESNIGTRLFRNHLDEIDLAIADHDDRLFEALTRKPVMADEGGLQCRALSLSSGARAAWIAAYDRWELSIASGGRWDAIADWGSKAAEHAGRLAATLAFYADPDAAEISEAHMAAGIQLADYYGGEVLRLAGAAEIDLELRQAQAVYDWWKVRDRLLPLTMFYQKGLSFSRKAATARRLLAILAEHGLAERHEAPGLEMWRRLP